MRKSLHGLGLVEVLIAASLALLLLLLIHRLMTPVLDTGEKTAARTQMRQQATLALQSLAKDYRQTAAHTLSYLPSDPDQPNAPLVLAMTPVKSVSSSGRKLFEESMVVYWWSPAEAKLRRQTWPPRPPTLGLTLDSGNASLLTPSQLLQMATTENGSARVLAHDVVQFDPLGLWPPAATCEASIRLQRFRRGTTEPEAVEIKRTVNFRN